MKTTIVIMSLCIFVATLTLLMLPMWSGAQPGGGDGQRPPQGPPPEAVAACENKSESDACDFTSPRGDTISGTCQTVEDQLACVPEGGPRGPEREKN